MSARTLVSSHMHVTMRANMHVRLRQGGKVGIGGRERERERERGGGGGGRLSLSSRTAVHHCRLTLTQTLRSAPLVAMAPQADASEGRL